MEKAKDRWQLPPIIEECKAEAKKRGLWNMFLPADRETGDTHGTMGLSNLEYAPICEVLGRSSIASEAVNCSAPDTGNMEVFARYGTAEHKEKWLKPLLNGEIRSAYAMTEPGVASSDAKNIATRAELVGDDLQGIALGGQTQHGLGEIGAVRAKHPARAKDQVIRPARLQGLLTCQLGLAINALRVGRISFHVSAGFVAVENVVGRVMNDQRAKTRRFLAEHARRDGVDRLRQCRLGFSPVHRRIPQPPVGGWRSGWTDRSLPDQPPPPRRAAPRPAAVQSQPGRSCQ
jgi:hypothetical protein